MTRHYQSAHFNPNVTRCLSHPTDIGPMRSANVNLRYVDDFALFHDDPAVLADWRQLIGAYLAHRRLSLHPRKTHMASTAAPSRFLGYVLLPGGRRRLTEDNVRRFRNRLRGLRDRWRADTIDLEDVERRVGAWIAHAGHAGTWRLRQAIFRAVDGSIRRGGLTGPLPRFAGRLLEQQSKEPALREPQQEPHRQPKQQHRVSAYCSGVLRTTGSWYSF